MNFSSGSREKKVTTSTISSLALLKVSYDLYSKDYFDNFVPMVAECLRRASADVVSLPDLQETLRERFGLAIPQNAIKTVLKRARKRGYVYLENRAYYRDEEELKNLGFQSEQSRVMQEHNFPIKEFVEFCYRHINFELSSEDADDALQSYLQENQLQLVNAVDQGTVIPSSGRSVRNFRYLVSSFIRYLRETNSVALSYLETVVKGHMLADAIFLPDPGSASRKFRNTEVYFDTPFLLNALGYSGEAQRAPCVELLELLYETGADLRCFTHTRDEVRGVVEACASQVQNGNVGDSPGSEVLRNFRLLGHSKTDVMMVSNKLEEELKALRIRVVDRPSYAEHENQIDEEVLHQELEKSINYSRSQQVTKDVESISAVMRLRRGKSPVRIEECQALFVTTNSALVRVAQRSLSSGSETNNIPPCITDHMLTNLLWLKKPTAAPDLPRKRIIADCYAATQPTEKLWRLYLQELDKLKQKNDVTSDEYYMLRNSVAAESALMEATLGEEEGFTQGTVPEILERIRSDIEARKQAEVDKEKTLRAATEAKLKDSQKQDSHRRARVKSHASRWAGRIVLSFKIFLIAILALATLLSFGWGSTLVSTLWMSYPVAGLFFVLFIFSLLSFWNGTTVESLARKCEVALERYIEQKLIYLSELE